MGRRPPGRHGRARAVARRPEGSQHLKIYYSLRIKAGWRRLAGRWRHGDSRAGAGRRDVAGKDSIRHKLHFCSFSKSVSPTRQAIEGVVGTWIGWSRDHSNPALGKQWPRDHPTDVPPQRRLATVTFATKNLLTGANGQKADAAAASSFCPQSFQVDRLGAVMVCRGGGGGRDTARQAIPRQPLRRLGRGWRPAGDH